MRRLLTISLLALALPARAQPVDATVFSVVTLDATARGAGLAGAVSAVPSDDAAAIFHNPALLSPASEGRLSLGLLDHLSSLRTGTLAYARAVRGVGTAAVGLRFLGWGDIPRIDAAGVQDGTFGAGEAALSLAASRDVRPGLRIGAALEGLRSSIDGQAATALAVDVGALLHRDESGFAASVSVHHAGSVLSSVGATDDELPTDVQVGVSKRLQHLPLLVSVTAYGLFRPDPPELDRGAAAVIFRHLLIGSEFVFSDAFQLRLGYDYRRHEALQMKSRLDFAGLSFGVGLRVRGIAIDYARTSWSSLGGVHRFGIATRL